MQVANALNNIIRILFNPKIEAFKLFDFLIVSSNDNRYLAQIIEIYDDKFDSSQNVAKLKITFKISENNEVMPYDNFTPSKECEIRKIKQEEIENFINDDKETFIFATNAKSSTSLNLQYDFFNNFPVILADKIEDSNVISLNIAKKLSEKKHSVIIDSTGVLEHDCAHKISASKEIKIPLNYTTIDYVFERCLHNASLEFQASAGAIINEIKKFAKKQPNEFIPFNTFLRVILEQYKVTPYPELKLLLVKMKKFQMDDIFARFKKDVESLKNAILKNQTTIIDISEVDLYWQKVYLEYITDTIKEEIYLITRINDENCSVDFINKIYNKRKNIKFVPTVSYNYKKLPSLLQYSKNYILLPSLTQRPDFLDANFALSNLITNECIIFGENTDNFLYLAKDYELLAQEKRKNYKKIALTLISQDEEESKVKENLGENGDYFENKQKIDSQKLMAELENLEEENAKKLEEAKTKEDFVELEEHPQNIELAVEHDDFDVKDENKEVNKESEDLLEFSQENAEDVSQSSYIEEDLKEESQENIKDENEANEEDLEEKDNSDSEEEFSFSDFSEDSSDKNEETSPKEVFEEEQEVQNISNDNIKEEKIIEEDKDELVFAQEDDFVIKEDENTKENSSSEDDNLEFSDEELDFFQMAQESELEQENSQKEEVKEEKEVPSETEKKEENNTDNDIIDFAQISDDTLDNSFQNIIDSKPEPTQSLLEVDENTKINEDILTQNNQKEDLPIFKEDTDKTEEETPKYNVNDVVVHQHFGKGTITKIIEYEGRPLLQIQFEESGEKKLLDPRVANIKLEQ